MRSTNLALAILAVAALTGCSTLLPSVFGYSYPLPDGRVSAEAICGKRSCDAGHNGTVLHFNSNPWSPSVGDQTTPKSVAEQIVGFASGTQDGRDPFTCSTTGRNPFGPSDIAPLGLSSGRKVDYSRTETLSIDVNAAVDADIKAMEAAGVFKTALKVDELRAKLTAAYQSLDKSKVSVSATYFEYGLTGDAYRDVFERNRYPECSSLIRSGKRQLITAAGVVWFNIDFDSSSAREQLAKLQADLEKSGVKFNVGASVRRTVSEVLRSSAKNGFQVIVVRRAGVSHF